MAANTMLEAALNLAASGWQIFPIRANTKDKPLIKAWQRNATSDQAQVSAWWGQWPGANIGIACGRSDICVVDLDVKRGVDGIASWAALCEKHGLNGNDVDTVTVTTPSGGKHLYFTLDVLNPYHGLSNTAGKLGPGIDTRAGAGYVLAPPSEVDGKPYQGNLNLGMRRLPAVIGDLLTKSGGSSQSTPSDRELLPYVRAALDQEVLNVTRATEGERNDTLNRAAYNLGQLVASSWANLDRAIVEVELERAARACGLEGGEVLATIKSGLDAGAKDPRPEPSERATVASNTSPEPDKEASNAQNTNQSGQGQKTPTPEGEAQEHGFFKCTDMGNGQRMATWHGHQIRYCAKLGAWLVWDGKRWAVDELSRIEWIAKRTVMGIYSEAGRCTDEAIRQEIAKWARASESGKGRREMIAAARSEPGIPILPDALDSDPMLLNVNNGLLNLRTGELMPHKQDALVTKLAPVDFDPIAECPQWIMFLARIMDNNNDMIAFLQRAVGYTLTGDVSERALFILYGTGDNGKSTFLETVRAMMGDYAMSAEAKTLMRHDRGAASGDIARLKGARLVTASESEHGDKLAEALIKQLTGGDRRVARLLYSNEFEYTPTDKLWLGTNHKPEISGTDPAIWNRVKLIPFSVTIPKAEQDTHLKDKLSTELPGILKWAVRGCLKWQKDGLQIPEPVRAATEDYKLDSDTLGRFIADCCIVHANAKGTLKDLYDDYMEWCVDNGEPNLTKRDFSAALVERGHTKRKGTGNKVEFGGLGQLTQEELAN